MKKKILIVTGDPNSINSEIIYKSWKKINTSLKKRIYFIGSFDLIKKQFSKLRYKEKILEVKNLDEKINEKYLKIINVGLKFKNPFKVPFKSASKYILQSLSLAHNLAISNKVQGIINCAIDKKLLIKNKIGVTELLAKKCNINDNSEVMLIRNEDFSVCPLTTHIDIKDVPKKINKSLIINKVKTINTWYKKKLKKKPHIGILGLNPHNAELRKKSEELSIIKPAVKRLKKYKINIKGPLVSDTIFVSEFKKYDVIVGMYHDQVLSPFKSIYKFDAINATLGLKYLRVSPDHGTGFNIIGKNKGNSLSLIRSIKFVNKLGK